MSDESSSSGKLWGGRFRSGVDPEIHRFTASLPFDRRLVRHDLIASLAHARMLMEAGVLGDSAAGAILTGLSTLLREVEEGKLSVEADDEDVHSWIERVLGERIGEPAQALHTARSRNDQTSAALRLYLRQSVEGIVGELLALEEVWLTQAAEHLETWLPGYSHLQRGQPTSLAHHLLAHVWAVAGDGRRFRQTHAAAGVSPLGAGALVGSPHPIRPERTAALLGLPQVFPNSMLAVADRDHVVEATCACALLMVHLSRWADEVVLWSSEEFRFLALDDRVAKGSSLMPQKKNPEPAELIRAKTGRVIGDLTGLLVAFKGLPLTYNSDLQEDKEALFDALDTAAASLRCARSLGQGLVYHPERMGEALERGFVTATDLADYLVGKGMAFRSAHEQTGRAVQAAEERGVELWELSLDDLRACCPGVEEDVLEVLRPEASVRSHATPGGPAPERVRDQLRQAAKEAMDLRRWLESQEPPPIYRAHLEARLLDDDL